MAGKEQSILDFGTVGEGLVRHRVDRGVLITFEGGEGVGKSTQAERLFRKLESLGIDTYLAHEPGSSDLGNNVRRWVKRTNTSSPLAETLLFEAARAELVSGILRPILSKGTIVVLDRFIDSTIAYQGYGRGMDVATIKRLNEIATGGLVPHLTVLLDLDPEESLARVSNEPSLFTSHDQLLPTRTDKDNERRFEDAPLKFHHDVRNGYLELSNKNPRWSVIKANQAGHRVADAILKRVRRLLIGNGIPADVFSR